MVQARRNALLHQEHYRRVQRRDAGRRGEGTPAGGDIGTRLGPFDLTISYTGETGGAASSARDVEMIEEGGHVAGALCERERAGRVT